MRYIIWQLATLLAIPAVARANVVYNISLNTAPLLSHPAGPFYLAFQLADGSGSGDGNAAALLDHFQFGGGAPDGSPILLGSAFERPGIRRPAYRQQFPQLFCAGIYSGIVAQLPAGIDYKSRRRHTR